MHYGLFVRGARISLCECCVKNPRSACPSPVSAAYHPSASPRVPTNADPANKVFHCSSQSGTKTKMTDGWSNESLLCPGDMPKFQ
jgi:hypothetical protein